MKRSIALHRGAGRCGLLLVIAAASIAPPTPAAADDTADCVAFHERGQLLRRQGKLEGARTEFVGCARTACPEIVRQDCSRRLADVEASEPTVVFAARDAGGRDVPDVRVLVDGAPIADRAGGLAVPIDPGEHRVRFEAKDGASAEVVVVLREGEKNRTLEARVASKRSAAPASAADAPAAGVDRPARGVPMATYVLGAIGIVGLGSFGGWAIAGRIEQSSLDLCKPYACADEDVDAMYRDYVIADISLGVGVAALAAAGIVYLVGSSAKPPPAVGRRSPLRGLYVTSPGTWRF